MQPQQVLIVGGGLAGLALARALTGNGLAVEVVERRETAQQQGSGLYLPANAVRALERVGLGAGLAERSVVVERQHLLDGKGRRLVEIDLAELWGSVGQCRAISRQDLHELLLTGLDPAVVRYGAAVTTVDDGTVTFADGSSRRYDLVVGADGIGSAVRESAFGAAEPEFLNQVCWRFIAEGHPELQDWTARLGSRGRAFLSVPLGGGRVYCYAEMATTEPSGPGASWREHFSDFAGPVAELLSQADNAYFAALAEVGLTEWIRPRTVLIGDAAHACSPSLAQGGAMALEDAVVLADELGHRPVAEALPAYQARRAQRIAWVLQQNRRRDRARSLPTPVRNAVLRMAGEKIVQGNHAQLYSMP